jgi:hypothetical protein
MPEREKGAEAKRTHAVIDRIEDGGVAVVHAGDDEGIRLELPASLLPEGAAEGSHLVITVSLDEDSRRAAEDRVKALQDKLEKRGSGGVGQKNFKL